MPKQNFSPSPAGVAQVTVTRDSQDDVQTRQIIVSLDGERKGELLFRDEISLAVSPGPHTIRVDNTWNRKDIDIHVDDGEHLHFLTKSTAGQFSRFLLVAFGAGPIYVSIQPAPVRASS